MSNDSGTAVVVKANPERKVFRPQKKNISKVPDDILNDPLLNEQILKLPKNYNFEVHKTIWRIRSTNSKRVALQMPEGLLMYSVTLCDIIEEFTDADTVIMGDVTYGACCVDDFTAEALGSDLLIHYGHSCLIPVDQTNRVKVMYIFVDIKIDASHFIETMKCNFTPETKFAFFSTIQFVTTLHAAANELRKLGYQIYIPQTKPLSPGEILGCTSPIVTEADAFVYLGDGRFHIESVMIANPKLKAYRYDPYEKQLTSEEYDHETMLRLRNEAITKASEAKVFGLILGTLGRQGSPNVLSLLQKKLRCSSRDYFIVLLSEITDPTLRCFSDTVEAWIQIACPRLSIDWGDKFQRPLLSPYEAAVSLNIAPHWNETSSKLYPMDFYSNESRGPWTPNHKPSNLVSTCCNSCSKN